MLDERATDHVEIEVLSFVPPRLRLRGPARAVAEAARVLVGEASSIAVEAPQEPAVEVCGPAESPLPPFEAMQTWLKARNSQPYTLLDLISDITGLSQGEVRGRFYVPPKGPSGRRTVGSDYRSAVYTRHARAVRELQTIGWHLKETKSNKSPTLFQLLAPEAPHAA